MKNPQSQGGSERSMPDLEMYVSRLAYAIDRGMASEVAPYDLSPLDASLLGICFEKGEECTATQLAELVPVDPARISRVVTKLVDMGLLRRRRLRSDRRVVMLRLTDKGDELTSEVLQHTEQYNARLTKGISQRDMRIFKSVASRIVANHAAMREDE